MATFSAILTSGHLEAPQWHTTQALIDNRCVAAELRTNSLSEDLFEREFDDDGGPRKGCDRRRRRFLSDHGGEEGFGAVVCARGGQHSAVGGGGGAQIRARRQLKMAGPDRTGVMRAALTTPSP